MPAETSSTTDVTMPQLGVSVVEGTILRWLVAVGDEVEADEPLCEIDTDKIVTEIPSPASGTLAEILVDEGGPSKSAPCSRGSPRARPSCGRVLSAPGARPSACPAAGRASSPPPARSASADYSPSSRASRSSMVWTWRALSAPGAGVGCASRTCWRQPSRGGRAAAAHREPIPARTEPRRSRAGQLSRMRRAIGAHMKRSLETAATCTTWMEADMSRVEARAAGEGERAGRRDRAADRRARARSRRSPSTLRSTRRSRASATRATTPSTSASPSRSARTA